jgi:O-antigen/teichoic acid export membrane protein
MLSDNLVIAQLQGAEAVTGYAVPWRLFNVAQTFLAIAPQALWPAYREAMVRGEHGWVAKAFRRSLRVGLALAVVPAAFLVAFGGPLVRMWVQGRVDPSRGLLAALAASMVVFAIGAAIANFLNALGAVRAQLVLMAIAAVLGLFLKVVLVSRLGPTGAPIASTCAYGAAFVIPGLWLAVRRMRHA